MNFIFYDIETTGTDTTFDQILQFAAILTDRNFNELDRFEIRCQLLQHVIPAPGAMLATRVTPAMLEDAKLPTHYQAMRAIAEKLKQWSPATFIGYNTLAFDEPLLRQAFFQTLQPIYLTNTNGNKRADVLRLAQASAILAPNAIAVPLNENQKPTLKLDRLAPANGFAHDNAHDALADVEATVFMARLIREHAPHVWHSLMPMIDKVEVTARALSGSPNCLVEHHIGQPSVRLVAGCGHSHNNPTMLCVFDLSHDPETVLRLDVDGLVSCMKGPNRPLRTIYANKMPALIELHALSALPPINALPLTTIETRTKLISEDLAFRHRIGEALAKRYPPFEPSEIVEQRIHDGFPGKADVRRMAEFHEATWEVRAELVETFEDVRFREIGRRLIFLEAPMALDKHSRDQLEQWLEYRRNGRRGVAAGRTVPDALAELEKLSADRVDSVIQLDEILTWLNR